MTHVLLVVGTDEEAIRAIACACDAAPVLDAEESALLQVVGRRAAQGARRVVVALAPWRSPDCVADMLAEAPLVTATSVVAVVDAPGFADRVAEGADLRAAEALVRQVESADVLFLQGDESLPLQTAEGRAVASALARGAFLAYDGVEAVGAETVWRARRQHATDRWIDWQGRDRVVDIRRRGVGVWKLRYQTRRPLHPGRLHAATRDAWDGVIRGHGTVWIATRPGVAWRWNQVGGGLRLEPIGAWLADVGDEGWRQLPPAMREEVRAGWHPYFGDRGQLLRLVGLDSDPEDILERVESCLLTDEELAEGNDAWEQLADPYAGVVSPTDLEPVHLLTA